jgi:hypothetical protein
MLSARDAFKVGFIARCAEDGLRPEEIRLRVKQAAELLEKHATFLGDMAGKVVDVGKGIGTAAVDWGVPLGLAAPPILGGMAGYGLARATDIDDTDVEDIKNQEVLQEYRRQSDRLRRERAVRDYRHARDVTGRIFL